MRSIQFIRIVLLLAVVGGIPACSSVPMDKQEAADWYSKYSSMVRWVGYQGSDAQFHHFIARVMDDWNFIQIRRDELSVQDERPFSTTSSGPLYYYLVDPAKEYRKIEAPGARRAGVSR